MDLTRIPLGNTVFEGENNAYLVEGEVTTLVDVGASTETVRADLEDGLDEAGIALSEIDRILLTHWHSDHCGLAGELQAESDATVYAHEDDAAVIAGDDDAIADLHDLRDRRFREWGIPEDKLDELRAVQSDFEAVAGDPADVETLADGDRITAGDEQLETIHLPGHAAGHVAFAFDREAEDPSETDAAPRSEVFVGDVILPEYTPNVGGADLRLDEPLERYVESLDRLAARDFDLAWPGHRDPIDDPSGRARVIREHHLDRTRRVIEALREHGPADAWTVSAHLFGELEHIHILHGPGEAYAHLDHLERVGAVEREDFEYRLVDSDPDVEALFPNTKY
ncbi:MBL fold metallo-hydrolase [Halobellus sp. EA9]|uniref:MBL fold metallo-hydrolase n=1 Tax=Halobellus sp. EA9 TaxID=3421647 RepID=UPI003EBD1A45